MVGLVDEGLGENGNCVAILCELDGRECGAAIVLLAADQFQRVEECTV